MTATTRPAWRCTVCGRVANAATMPRSHMRNGRPCGPFEAVSVGEASREVLRGEVVDPLLRYRVTTLRRFATECPRSTILGSDQTTGSIGTAGLRGSLMHAAIAEILRTLWRENARQLPATEDGVAILREVANAGAWVITPADMFGVRNLDGTTAQSGLVQMISSFAQHRWEAPQRLLIIEGAAAPFDGEGRLTLEIACPDGEIRPLSGAPDLVVSDPPHGLVIVDHKQSMARPVQPNVAPPPGEPIRGLQYMTDPASDYFQLCAYAALALAAFPARQIRTVTLREMNWRWMGPPREITITRDVVEEHVIPYLGVVMMQLDRARREGEGCELTRPRPGKHCNTRCSVKHSCPIPAEERGLGAIDGEDAADEMARRWRVLRALEPEMRAALKAWHEQTGHCPDAGSGQVVRWDGERPGRKFGFHAPPGDGAAGSDDDFIAPWRKMLEQQAP